MKWSIRIATVAGIPVFLHVTFVALVAFVFLQDWARGHDVRAALGGVLFILAIFGTVVLHEFGHAFAARAYGIATRDITLLPIGGLARLERMPDVPRQELWVALAGPAVNVALAGGTALLLLALDASLLPRGADMAVFGGDASPTLAGVLQRFLITNLWLAGFNLVPAFPMDGGRALRAVLAERMDYVKATETAASLGQALALVFGIIGLFSNPFLMFIALFVWMGASAEASSVSVRGALSGVPVSRAMITDFRAVDADAPLQSAAALVIAGSQRDFPVLEEGRLVGVLTRDALVKAITERGLTSSVREAMATNFETVDARALLEGALQRLQECHCPVLPVVYDGRLVGLLTADNVVEFIMIQGALRPARRG